MLETADIELLVALADSGQLAKAAARLEVHHATAFRRLNALEERWGTRLFERFTHGYVLTSAGESALLQAREMRERLLTLEGELRGHDAALAGRVRMTTSDGLAAEFLPRHLAALAQRFPAIQIDLSVDNRVADLNERAVDIAVRPAKRLSGRLVGRRAADMEFALYAAPGYVAQKGPMKDDPPDFTAHRFCGYPESLGFFSSAIWLARNVKPAQIAFRANQLGTMLGWARAGGGIAVLPCVLGEGAPGVVRMWGPDPAMTVGLWLCTHPHIRKVAKVRAVLDGLFESIKADAGALRAPPRLPA